MYQLNQKPLPLDIESKVDFDQSTGCWMWNHGKSKYGRYLVKGRKFYLEQAHRFVFEYYNGPIPDGKLMDHKCHTPRCVNPAHLRVCTPLENARHRTNNKRKKSSKFKGVHWSNHYKAWKASIRIKTTKRKEIRKQLGPFKSEVAAALAYDYEAVKYFGEFACTNRMLDLY